MIFSSISIRVLVVDDDEDDYFLTESIIRSIEGANFSVHWAYRYKDALNLILAEEYDLFFVDYYLGAKTGLDLLREAKENGCNAPMILLTGKGNREVDIEAMRIGAADYLVKADLNPDLIERSIRYSLENGRALKALRTNELRYRNIFEKSKDAIFFADESLRFLTVNDSTCNLLEYDQEAIKKLSLYDLIQEEQQKTELRHLLINYKSMNDLELLLKSQSGEDIYAIFSYSFIEQSGESRYIQGMIHDITAMKKAEKANVLAEKLATTDRLARTLAHEIRNPLTNIHLSVDHLLQLPDDGADSKSYYDIINRSAVRIGSIISELLDTARTKEIMLKECILQEIIEESVLSAKDRIQLKNIQLELLLPEDSLMVMADKEKLKIALLNITINAVEAMPETNGHLVIAVADSNEEDVLIRIQDNGTGISPDNLPRLFEPYFTAKRNGLGLGLAATLSILQAHKATVDVDSEVGVGTTFKIRLKRSLPA